MEEQVMLGILQIVRNAWRAGVWGKMEEIIRSHIMNVLRVIIRKSDVTGYEILFLFSPNLSKAPKLRAIAVKRSNRHIIRSY